MTRVKTFTMALFILSWGLVRVVWQWPDSDAHLIVCDVGQGDAILIISGFTQVLIDGGPDDKVMECLGRHLPFWDRQLELVVATHSDQDHIGGLPAVLAGFEVNHFLQTNQHKESDGFTQFQEITSRKQQSGMRVELPRVGRVFYLESDSYLQILWPPAETQLSALLEENEASKISDNDGSIVLLWVKKHKRFLLTGDLEVAGESALIAQGLLLDIDVLKVGHHGSKTSSTPEFLAITRPEWALISCGKKNRFGHPHDQVIAHLEKVGADILRTDLSGDLEIVTDGEEIWRPE